MRISLLLLSLSACSALTSACTTTTMGNATSDASADGAGAISSMGLTCLAVLQCAIACGSNSQPCEDACLASGDPAAQVKATAFSDCLAKNMCMDSACIEANCIDSLAACVRRPPQSGGAPITGNAPTGVVPSNFVGTWKYANVYGTVDDFTFNADGSGSRKQLDTAGLSGCNNTTVFQDDGTVVFNGDATGFTFYITSSSTTLNTCGQAQTTPGTTGAFDFTVEPIPMLGPNKMWFFRVQNCPVTAEVDKRIQCGHEYDM